MKKILFFILFWGGVGGGGARVSDFFSTKNLNKKKISGLGVGWGVGGLD